ncbi:unnamed protein product, partial [Scytosiphon promiscuus]
MDDYRAALSLVEKGLSATAAFETGRQRRDSRRRLLQQLQQEPGAIDATAEAPAASTGKATPASKASKITITPASTAEADWRRAGERLARHHSSFGSDASAGGASTRRASDASSSAGTGWGAEDRKEESGPVTAEQARRELEVLVRSESGRARFLQALNERRSEATEVTPEAYDALVATLHVFLDGCGPPPPSPPPRSPTPTPTPAPPVPPVVPAKSPPPMTPTAGGTRSSSRVSPSSSMPTSVDTGRSPPVSPAGAFVGRMSARQKRRNGSAVKREARGEPSTVDRRKHERANGDLTSALGADLFASAASATTRASHPAPLAEGDAGRRGDAKIARGASTSPGGRSDRIASLTLPPRASFTLGSSSSAATPQTTPTRVLLGTTPLGPAPALGSPTRPRASTVSTTTTITTTATAVTAPPTPQAPNAIAHAAGSGGNTSPANRSTVSSSSNTSSIGGGGGGGGAAGVNRQQRSTGANLFELAASIMRGGGGNANSGGAGAGGPGAQNRTWGARGAAGGGAAGWAERRNLIPGARGGQASSVSSVGGGRGGSASGTVGAAAGWFDPYSISNLGGGYHPAMHHGTLAETVELALGRGRTGVAAGAGAATTSSRGRSGSVYDVGASARLQGEGGTLAGLGGEGYMDIRSARQAMILANTFFKTEGGGSTGGDGGGDGREGRTYLLKELRDHRLWKHPQFWHEALMLGVKEQLQEGLANMSKWDDLKGEARREAVARTHNVVFSQLASIAFNMLECGVDGECVRADVKRKCRESQLGEALVQELMRDLDRRIRLSEAEHDRLGRLPSSSSTITATDHEDEPHPPTASPAAITAESSAEPPSRPASTPAAGVPSAAAHASAAVPSVVAAHAGPRTTSSAGDPGAAGGVAAPSPLRSALGAIPAVTV